MLASQLPATSRTSQVAFSFLALCLACAPAAFAQGQREQVVVFGTSLSDPGNAFALVGGTNTPPHYSLDPLMVPSLPYARGGHHLSNGPTWIEQLARWMHAGQSAQPAFRSANPYARNFAVATARASDNGINLNLADQVDFFLARTGGAAPADALYVIEMGSNDVRDALLAFGRGGHAAIIGSGVTSIATQITRIYLAGARNFLVWNVPNIALTPAIRTADLLQPGTAFLTTQLALTFNAALGAALSQLGAQLPGLSIRTLDTFALITEVVEDPASFGFTNVSRPCITPDVPPFVCRQPDDFLFWDGIHPTAAMHTVIAAEAALLLTQ